MPSTKMNLKMKSYKGGDLKGLWLFTRKLDGVCVILDCAARTAMSKRGKPLHNFEEIFDTYPDYFGVFEVFRDDWETTVSLVRTQESDNKVSLFDLNRIDHVDRHLELAKVLDPTEAEIKGALAVALAKGEEGLVLVPWTPGASQADYEAKRIKVKDEITIDIRVTGIQLGTGKYAGMVGALLTDYGKVGTGFTDHERGNMPDSIIGQIIEVGIMEWTKDNKMRHPRFKRVRHDKQEENLER